MSGILRRHQDICPTPQTLDDAAAQLSTFGKAGPLSWHYELIRLPFTFMKPPGSQPSDLFSRLVGEIDVLASGMVGRPPTDPFFRLSVNFVIHPIRTDSSQRDAWHLDKHITAPSGTVIPPSNAHPLYHLQQGGIELHQLGNNVGGWILLHQPRLAFPPMDAILAIDYFLSQYLGDNWQKIKANVLYQLIVRAAQDRLWKPHYSELADHWSTTKSGQAVDLQPTLV